ncbi:histidine phosphatase superfamily [Aspergillus pseudoustus]|uniref:3-phytase n=1 Tax=Aspergillus pseudoustus TaxID=1810923 RepID=A0ABR4JE18_9EURO
MLVFCVIACLVGASLQTENNLDVPNPTSVPDYFQTTYGPFAGATKAGEAPFLAQTNPVLHEPTYVPNAPLVTTLSISGQPRGGNIFALMGTLSPYRANPDGFGVDEYALPPGANITQIHMVHRHGARYPTSGSATAEWAQKLIDSRKNRTVFSGDLAFLNSWDYKLGEAELTARGRQELFDSGVLHFFNYGKLYNAASKIIARTTTMVRMLQSAENFLIGFFGPAWTSNATLEVIVESDGFNNSLAGNKMCENANNDNGATGDEAMDAWRAVYLRNATERFRRQISGSSNLNWTVEDTYNAQTMCSYETVALGYSSFCMLFTWEEWEGFAYMTDLKLYGNYGMGSPVGRSIGLGFVEELIARLERHFPDPPEDSIAFNRTLDEQTSTFPLNQSIYFDFSHDNEMFSMLTALGLTQFGQFLPATHPSPKRALVGSHIVPFAARFVIEVIHAPRPIRATRTRNGRTLDSVYEDRGGETTYVHLLVNQRTVPLGRSIAACGRRDDGWCELGTFIQAQRYNIEKANYEASCFGNYSLPAYGEIRDGAFPRNGTL